MALSAKHYFVDESGDGLLFAGSRGRPVVGPGRPNRFFILGLLDVTDPPGLTTRLTEAREAIRSDPYFKNVPSLQPEANKTAKMFHAKDDLPEIRREVFKILAGEDVKFSAVIKDMAAVLRYVRSRNAHDPLYRYHPNELYDYAVRALFKGRLHREEKCRICFARRFKSSRTRALTAALEHSRTQFCIRHGLRPETTMQVEARHSFEEPCLQACDYFLWALQRLYTSGEDRFWASMASKVSLVLDMDDTRSRPYGEYYTRKRPLTREAVKDRLGI